MKKMLVSAHRNYSRIAFTENLCEERAQRENLSWPDGVVVVEIILYPEIFNILTAMTMAVPRFEKTLIEVFRAGYNAGKETP